MKKFILFFSLLIGIGCAKKDNTINKKAKIIETNREKAEVNYFRVTDPRPTIKKEPYDINFQLKKITDKDYSLLIFMELRDGSHFVSPYSSARFKGRFGVSIDKNDQLVLNSEFVESPPTVEEFDSHPFVNGLVNWVRVNTTYTYNLKANVIDDIETSGVVRFTIEPRCTLEEVPFVIYTESGQLKVKKIKGGC